MWRLPDASAAIADGGKHLGSSRYCSSPLRRTSGVVDLRFRQSRALRRQGGRKGAIKTRRNLRRSCAVSNRFHEILTPPCPDLHVPTSVARLKPRPRGVASGFARTSIRTDHARIMRGHGMNLAFGQLAFGQQYSGPKEMIRCWSLTPCACFAEAAR